MGWRHSDVSQPEVGTRLAARRVLTGQCLARAGVVDPHLQRVDPWRYSDGQVKIGFVMDHLAHGPFVRRQIDQRDPVPLRPNYTISDQAQRQLVGGELVERLPPELRGD